MILVTVGTDLPFDRLVRAVDAWAASRGRTDVFAQIGEGAWRPTTIPSAPFLEPAEFARRFAEADVVVAHAGMGTILSALQHGKPLLVMPRRASLGEQRNEHQLATARHLSALGKVNVAFDEEELVRELDRLDALQVRATLGPYACKSLTDTIHAFIHRGVLPGLLPGGAP